jgi:Ca-activated chloride channel family protein
MKGSELLFADLWLAAALLPLVALWAVARWVLPRLLAGRPSSGAAVRYSTVTRLKRLAPAPTLRLRKLVEALRLPVLALLVLAMARPQTGHKLTQVTTEGVDIVIALDASGSMQALDLDADRPITRRRNRLEVAKSVVEDFVARREHDQIGLVVFGAEAFTQCPLTLDHGIVATFLERVAIGVAGDATAIGSGLATAVKRLKESPAKSKAVILLTDGRNNAGPISPATAAEIARTYGVKVYTVGAGTRGQAPFVVDTLFGPRVAYQDVDIDEESLRRIAAATGGRYFRAEDTPALASIYEEIDRLEKTEITMQSYMEYNERFPWFVLPAVALLIGEVVLLGTRFRKLP